jgi:DNA-binding transcriptional regulator YiaG
MTKSPESQGKMHFFLEQNRPLAYIVPMKGNDLSNWRKKQRRTQMQLANDLGVDVTTVSRWERGVRGMPPHIPLALEALENRIKGGK